MFKKIVSNLPFSPALVGQLSVFSKKLKQEDNIRRLGIVFVALTLIVQSLIILKPTETASISKNSISSLKSTTLDDNIIQTIYASNLSKGFIEASSALADSGDRISYTLTLENTSIDKTITSSFDINLSDILEYAVITDKGGATLDDSNSMLSWPLTSLEPISKQTRTFNVRILDEIPATAKDSSVAESYDCKITTKFGGTITISTYCPVMKSAENLISNFPTISQLTALTFSAVIFITSLFLYIRTRQFEKEIRLIRKDVGTGTI